MFYVYELIDPRIHGPYYVGMTNNPERRYKQHLSDGGIMAERVRTTKAIKIAGLKSEMRIIETIEDEEQAKEREKYWIQTYRKQGYHLTNDTFKYKEKAKPLLLVNKQVLDWMWQTRVNPIEKLSNPVRKRQRKEELLELIWDVHLPDELTEEQTECLIKWYQAKKTEITG